jgi:hypothetical protein
MSALGLGYIKTPFARKSVRSQDQFGLRPRSQPSEFRKFRPYAAGSSCPPCAGNGNFHAETSPQERARRLINLAVIDVSLPISWRARSSPFIPGRLGPKARGKKVDQAPHLG